MSAMVLKDVLAPQLLLQLRALLAAELFSAGAESASGEARRVKNNQQLSERSNPVGAECADLVAAALQANLVLRNLAIPARMTRPLFNLYQAGMSYGAHSDAALMDSPGGPLRADLSMTIFLSAPSEYDGGELVSSAVDGTVRTVKLEAGDAVLYPAGTLHEVRPVTRGSRLASIVWIQSAVPEREQRDLLLELDRTRRALEDGNLAEVRQRMILVRENLVRLWARP